MACQIDGCTLHHWSGISVGETDGTALTKDAHKLATKRQSLRWVLIGEVSMISVQLVGVLDILIGKVTWKCDNWKRRADGTERSVGGLDVLFFGDFSQLKPVSGTTLASHPKVAVGSIATDGNNGVPESSGRRRRNKKMAWRLPGTAQSPKPVCRRPPVCVGSADLLVSRRPGGFELTKRLLWRSPGGAGSAKTVVWRLPGSVGPRKPIV